MTDPGGNDPVLEDEDDQEVTVEAVDNDPVDEPAGSDDDVPPDEVT